MQIRKFPESILLRDFLSLILSIAIILEENPDEGPMEFEYIDLTNNPPSPSVVIVFSPSMHHKAQHVANTKNRIS